MSGIRIAVLASGGGTNLQAIIDAKLHNADIGIVLSDNPASGALVRAKQAGIKNIAIPPAEYKTREEHDTAIAEALLYERVDLVVLAGYMRLMTACVLKQFPNRVINIHPALLPSFPGINAQKQALDYGAKVSGCSVHFVDEGIDTGPIIAQVSVPVRDDDTAQTLSLRILAEEHKLYPYIISKFAEGKVILRGRAVTVLA